MAGGLLKTVRRHQSTIAKCVYRPVGVYFGYRILNHEVYEADTAEPLLVVLGLWLCGVPIAALLDGLKKLGAATQKLTSAEEGEAAPASPPPEPSAGEGVRP